MITLCVIIYVVFSLSMAYHKYYNVHYDYCLNNINKCYLNWHKSLLYGFLCLPTFILLMCGISALIYYGFACVLRILTWFLTNMP